MTRRPASPGSWHSVAVLAVVIALAACGGSAGEPDVEPIPGASAGGSGGPAGGGDGPRGGDNGPNGSSADGPITATLDSGTYAYTAGRCEIVDDVVQVIAVADDQLGGFEATLPPWDREMAYAQRDGSVSMSYVGSEPGEFLELVADRGSPETTWEWTVSGSVVEIVARMANRTNATRDQGIEQFTDYRDVKIRIECSGGAFGSGVVAERFAQEAFYPLQDPMQRVPGSVTVDLEGTEYEISYLTTCQFYQDQVSAEGVANDANVWLYSEGAGVHLNFVIGDRRDEAEGADLPRWGLPPEAELQDDFQFAGSDTVRSWTGTVVSEDGEEADATITLECTEGDAFDSAGRGSIVLDGVTHVLDVVSTCSIDGTTVDFFGEASGSRVFLVVTGGGSEILFADEAGQQSSTRGLVFNVSGQQATWTGTLAGTAQATVTIACG